MSNQQKNGSIIAIVTMMFLYAMISFVTNLGAPIGVIWKNQTSSWVSPQVRC